MFLKNVISVMVCALLFCLVVMDCDKKAPNENDESIQCEKDGVITLLMIKNIADSTTTEPDNQVPLPSDSFFVSESGHKLVIENAIPVSIPKMNNTTFFFKGDFNGLEDEVILWTDHTYTSTSGKRKRDVFADKIHNNRGIGYFMRTDTPNSDPVTGYLFCLDKDNDNSGVGKLIISQENYSDTVWVDAAQNTVCYPPLFANLDVTFEDRGFMRNLQFECPDKESFIYSNSGVIYFFTSDTSNRIIAIGTSWSSGGISVENLTIQLKMYAFVPEFINRKD